MKDFPFSMFSNHFKKRKQKYKDISDETHTLYKERISEEFADFMKLEGLCVYDEGLFTTVDPLEYDAVLNDYQLASTSNVPLLKNAFGDIFYFDGSDCRILYVSFKENYSFASVHAVKYFFIVQLTDNSFAKENFKKKLFKQALQMYGLLNENETYGFVPVLPLGGTENVNNIQKVKTVEYLSMLSQMFS